MKVEVVCKVCGKHEHVCESRAKKYVTCSRECMGKPNSERYSQKVTLTCPICGKEYQCKKSSINRHRTCGNKECKTKWLSKTRSGSGNSNYKNYSDLLKNKSSSGKKHDASKTIYRHIVKLVFNLPTEKDIPHGYVVHHKDANHENNDPKNLILLPKTEHILLHRLFGNILLKALHTNKISSEVFYSMCDNVQKEFYEKIENLNILNQKIITKKEYSEMENVMNVYKYIII